MRFYLRNSWKHVGGDRWEWTAFIESENQSDLAKIDMVEYVLHDTFQNPIRRVRERGGNGGFAMKTEGWGTFSLKAFVHLKDGKKIPLTRLLQLKFDPPEGMSPSLVPALAH